jgi:hypothetical protein
MDMLGKYYGHKISDDKLNIMYEKVKHFNTDIVLKAIDAIIESDNKTFPALGQLMSACREQRAMYEKTHPPEQKVRGCIRCYCGSVYYIKNGKPVSGHCAVCFNGESRSYPGFYVQIDDRIYTAYREQGAMFVADPRSRGNAIPYKPEHTNEWLERCHGAPMFKDMPQDEVKRIMRDNPLVGIKI